MTLDEAWAAPLEPTTPRERTASDVLLAAARYIEEHGWWQDGGKHPGGSPACLLTAIARVTGWGRDDENKRLLGAANRALAVTLGRFDTWVWNDDPGRTEAEVIAALREAAGAPS